MISKTILLLGNKQLYVCNQNHPIVTKTRHYADKKCFNYFLITIDSQKLIFFSISIILFWNKVINKKKSN